MGKQRYKCIRSGRVVSEILYVPAMRMDSDVARMAKLKYSSLARQQLKNDTATHKLELKLAGNFIEDDYWVTLTYDDDHLPIGPEERRIAKGRASRFMDDLRAARKLEGSVLRYAYCTESVTSGKRRLHHHCVINATGYTRDRDVWRKTWTHDLEQIKSLWRQGDAHVETFRMAERRNGERSTPRESPQTSFDDSHLVFRSGNIWENIARYVVKERREKEAKPIGEHAWNCSRNLSKPFVTSEWVEGSAELVVPADAVELGTRRESNAYGSFQWVKYILPEIHAR